jgi:hypothetical protein
MTGPGTALRWNSVSGTGSLLGGTVPRPVLALALITLAVRLAHNGHPLRGHGPVTPVVEVVQARVDAVEARATSRTTTTGRRPGLARRIGDNHGHEATAPETIS